MTSFVDDHVTEFSPQASNMALLIKCIFVVNKENIIQKIKRFHN